MLESLEGILEPRDEDGALWRFMDFTKYVSMLHRRALFFARADQLPDPFEGLYVPHHRAGAPGGEIDLRLREEVYVNCWHVNQHESAAMWRIYLKGDDGIALRTTASRLRDVLARGQETIYLGVVRYLDYEHERVPRGHEIHPFFCKRKPFDYEREVRALWRTRERSQDDLGRYFSVSLEHLIEEVVVSPLSEPWLEELVRSVTDRFELALPVVTSSMREPPRAH